MIQFKSIDLVKNEFRSRGIDKKDFMPSLDADRIQSINDLWIVNSKLNVQNILSKGNDISRLNNKSSH